ncbi:MAG: hypothetical protein LH609_12860 [Rudanella sp.]|nr:hypothetical protein [Rudanella sp.]
MRSILFFLLISPRLLVAQPTSPLDRVVSVEVRNERVSEVLRQMSQQANFAFSYNPAVVNDTRMVTLRTGRQPVRIILAQLFQGQTVTWKVRGNHVLLLGEGETKRSNPDREPTHFFLDGYITDGQTGRKIASASIYERTSLASTVSNPYGYYRLKLAHNLPTNARVEVRKRLYMGESVSVATRQSRTVDVRLRAIPTAQPPATTPVATSTTATVTAAPPDTLPPQPEPTPTLAQADTIRPILPDSPPAQTAQADSLPSQTDSSPSIQRPSGREQARDLINQIYTAAQQLIHRQNLDADTLYRPFQLSVFPYIGTNHRLSNHVINHLSINVFMGTALGVTGLEVGGFINLVRADVRGGQFAGFGNVVGRNVYGMQAAGFFNKTWGEVHGMQVAGFSNRSGDLRHGLQIAGFVNHARHVTNSLQIGVINTAESTNSVPIGLLSFVRTNGYKRFEVGANETFPVNLTFRTGVKWFYNLLTVGAIPTDTNGESVWQVGYGLGTGIRLGRTGMATLEASSHFVGNTQLNQTFGQGSPSTMFRATALLEKRFGRLALAAGPTWSLYNTGGQLDNPAKNPLANTRLRIQNSPIVSSLPFTSNGWASWFGWQVGVRWAN